MKSLLLQKLYRLHRVYVYGMIVSLLLFEVGMLVLSRARDAVHVDFWVTGGVLCFMLLCFVLTAGRNAQEYAQQMKLTKRNAVLLAVLFIFSLLSMGKVSTFLYFKY